MVKNLVRQIELAVLVFLIAVLVGCAPPTPDKGRVTECELFGGEKIPQPDNSSITACCYDSGCWICDGNGEDCSFDPVYSSAVWKDAPFFQKLDNK